MSFDSFLISLLYTVIIYFIPVLIYRYCVRRYPMTKKAARAFSTIYMAVAFFCSAFIQAFWLGLSTTANTIPWLWYFINYRILVSPSESDIKKVHVEGFPKNYVYMESERDRLFRGMSEDILQGCKELRHSKKELYDYLNDLIATEELSEQGASILYQEYITHAKMGTLPVYTKKEETPDPEAALSASEDKQVDVFPTEMSVDCPVADQQAAESEELREVESDVPIETVSEDEGDIDDEVSDNGDCGHADEGQVAVFCRHCGEEIPEGNTFCHKCGTRVIEDQDSVIQYCRFCGAQLEKESVFCGKCGTKISEV